MGKSNKIVCALFLLVLLSGINGNYFFLMEAVQNIFCIFSDICLNMGRGPAYSQNHRQTWHFGTFRGRVYLGWNYNAFKSHRDRAGTEGVIEITLETG